MRQGWTPMVAGLLAVGLGLSLAVGLGSASSAQSPSPAGPSGDLILPDSMLGNQVAPMLLLTRPEVRAELGLTAEQAESARKTLASLRAQAQSIRGQGNDPAAIARRRAIDEVQTRWLQDNLDPEQTLRLGQVDLQWQGPWALSRSLAAEMLGLSDEQANKVRRLLADAPTASTTIDRVIDVLTPAQRERWKNLLGKPVAFSKPAAAPSTDREVGQASTNSRPAPPPR